MKGEARMGSRLSPIQHTTRLCLGSIVPVVNVQALHCVDAIIAFSGIESSSVNCWSKGQLRRGTSKHTRNDAQCM